jgi:hypothetical protein
MDTYLQIEPKAKCEVSSSHDRDICELHWLKLPRLMFVQSTALRIPSLSHGPS